MKRKIILAENSGYCFGVKRAVDETIKIKSESSENIYTLGPLIHNNNVVNDLKKQGVIAINNENFSDLNKGDVVVIRSHGVKESTINYLNDNGFIVKDNTCPYVTNIHEKVKKYYSLGYKILIIGNKDHPEVIGINGWCNDEAIIINLDNLDVELPKKVCVVSQTTEKKSTWNKVLAKVSDECKEFIAFNTICLATDTRQKSARDIAKKADMVLVIGGKSSSNTTKLYEICKEECSNVYHIENKDDLTEDIINFNCETIGITAGASTPDYIIKEVITILERK